MSESEQVEVFLRLLLAFVVGSIVGVEREWRGHEAGLRTSALVCFGAALFGEVSIIVGDSRVAAGVVQGVGFLGAGLIFHKDSGPTGVTTATTIWVLAGLGLVIAYDLWLTAILIAVTVVFLLELAPVSDWIYQQGKKYRRRKGLPEPDSG